MRIKVLIALLLAFEFFVRPTNHAFDAYREEDGNPNVIAVQADLVATGIPGAGAIAQVGTFHKGGPFHDKADFAALTTAGTVLDAKRLLVASTSNFGAPLARSAEAPGAILSIDVDGPTVAVPEAFAASGGQASAAAGRVILYAAQSGAFLNGNNNPNALTNDRPSVSLPLGISINNGFGRPWFANAPAGSAGDGTITVIDPGGAPLAGAPDPAAGGVFAGAITNRSASSTHGLTSAAVATALAGKSPDQSIRAVFFAAEADGSIVQVHVEKGVDGFTAPDTFTPLPFVDVATAESPMPAAATRIGMLFNWAPLPILFVSDPLGNRIVRIAMAAEDDTAHELFEPTHIDHLQSRWLNVPVDLAPAVPEAAARNFASNTTLGAGSDFYVVNRGDNTIVRMTQGGHVVAARRITSNVPGFRLNGIAVSDDARTIWMTATASNRQGIVLKTSAFGAGAVTTTLLQRAAGDGAAGAIAQGADIFNRAFDVEEGLGPLFNGRGCVSCHNRSGDGAFAGGMGVTPDTTVTRIGRIEHGEFHMLPSHGPIARDQSIASLGYPCDAQPGAPKEANAFSLRSAATLRGTSLIDNIRVGDIDRVRRSEPEAVRGHFNVLADGRIGRFGWKAQTATLVEFMGEALRDEIGVTNAIERKDFTTRCGADSSKMEADAAPLTSLVAFLNTIDPPVPPAAVRNSDGAAIFTNLGCAACHTPSMPGPGSGAPVFLYSDLLLHDMGDILADGFVQGSAGGREFRTAPLWRVADRPQLLHDGRAKSMTDAILAHGGQAAGARDAFTALSPAEVEALLEFLRGI